MPYPTNDSLPDAVKSKLPPEAQEVWRNAFNEALKQTPDDEGKATTMAWTAVKDAGWIKEDDKWVKHTRDQTYSVWTSMKARCHNQNDKDYARYGGRGIVVCERWQASFEDFIKDMGSRPDGHTIERINNNGNYEPKNCKWVDRATQAKNRNHAMTHEFDAEVFSVGTWHGDKYSETDLDDMVKNFDSLKEKIKPPVKLGHNDKQTQDGQPSLGWVTGLKRIGSKLIATLTSVPDIVHKALQSGRYKRVSSEVYWNYKSGNETFKRVLAGVALLGADIPEVNNLEDLTAFLSQSTGKPGSFDEIKAYSFDVNDDGDIKNKEDNNVDEKLKAENEALKKKIEALQGQLDAMKGKEKEAGQKGEEDKLKAFCEERVKDGKMTPAGRDIILNGGKHSYAEDNKIILNIEDVQKYMETSWETMDIKELGVKGKTKDNKEYKTADEELAAKAQAYSGEHKIDYSTAIQAVLAEDHKLATWYVQETEDVREG